MKPKLLIVDDDLDDVTMLTGAMADLALQADVQVVHDGEAALEALRRSRPSLVILDLNLPKMSGQDVLAEMRADPRIRSVPVVVLTGLNDSGAIDRAYSLGASSVMLKPDRDMALREMVDGLFRYWFKLVVLPT